MFQFGGRVFEERECLHTHDNVILYNVLNSFLPPPLYSVSRAGPPVRPITWRRMEGAFVHFYALDEMKFWKVYLVKFPEWYDLTSFIMKLSLGRN